MKLRRELGFIEYYHGFVQNYDSIITPLTQLLNDIQPFLIIEHMVKPINATDINIKLKLVFEVSLGKVFSICSCSGLSCEPEPGPLSLYL